MPEDRLKVEISRRERAREKAKRWAGFLKEATVGVRQTLKRRKGLTEALHTADRKRKHHGRRIEELRAEREIAEKGNPSGIPSIEKRITHHQREQTKAADRIKALEERIDEENDRLVAVKARAKRGVRKRRYWRKRFTGSIRKIVHIRELRKQRKRGQPEFQPWMANGADYRNASKGAKAFIARAVVLHGLSCTSMARTYVPAGGSTVSYHLTWNGGRAGDAAGSREAMVKCQHAEYRRGLGLTGQLEMFGPDNDKNLKYGQSLSQAEGSLNEDLHDSHVHCAEEDSAVTAALR